MVANSGGSYGNDVVPRMPSGSSSAGRGGSSGSLARQALKKGPWTAAEDAILIEYVKKNGEGNWNAVQKNTSLSRCGKSCRLRWTNHLRPNLKKGSFTPEEERLILQLHAQLGNKWARMAAQLPGRTDNEIKNYWNTRIKRRIRQGLPLYPNHLAPQRQPTSPPVQTGLQAVPAATVQGRPPLQIPNRTISQQVLAQPHSPSPHSPTILSPAVILDRYQSPADTFFPGFSLAHQTSPLSFPTASSFQFSPLNFNTTSLQALQTPQSPCTFYTPLKPVELPSNQLFSPQVNETVPMPEPEPEPETRSMPSVPRNSSIGLLEDLLEHAEALASNENSNLSPLQDGKFEFSSKSGYAWDKATGSKNSSAGTGMGIKDEVGEDNWSEEISKLLQYIPSPANIPGGGLDHLCDSMNVPALDHFCPGVAAMEDSIGLDTQQLASIFQVDPASCPWSSMPRIC